MPAPCVARSLFAPPGQLRSDTCRRFSNSNPAPCFHRYLPPSLSLRRSSSCPSVRLPLQLRLLACQPSPPSQVLAAAGLGGQLPLRHGHRRDPRDAGQPAQHQLHPLPQVRPREGATRARRERGGVQQGRGGDVGRGGALLAIAVARQRETGAWRRRLVTVSATPSRLSGEPSGSPPGHRCHSLGVGSPPCRRRLA